MSSAQYRVCTSQRILTQRIQQTGPPLSLVNGDFSTSAAYIGTLIKCFPEMVEGFRRRARADVEENTDGRLEKTRLGITGT